MAIQNLAFPELLRYPNWGNYENGTWGTSSVLLDASGEYLGNVFSAPKSGSITKIHFGVSAVSASGDVDVRVETVDDTDGLNSGTLWATDTNKKITVSSTGMQTATLTASASVTAGDMIAVVCVADATSTPNINATTFSGTKTGFPYRVLSIGSPQKSDFFSAIIWIEYSDGTQPNIPWVRKFTSSSSSALMTADRRYGIRFQLPFDAVISGWWTQNDYSDNANNTVEIYGADGVTVEKTATVNGNIRQAGPSPCYHFFSTDFNAKARTWYRLTMRTSVTTGSAFYTVSIPDVDHLWDVGGQDFIVQENGLFEPVHYTYTTAAAAPTAESDWTNVLGQTTPMSLLISEISEYSPEVKGVMGLS
jgi:hypothetical protein